MLSLNRRGFLAGGAALAAGPGLYPAWAAPVSHGLVTKGSGTLSGNDIALTVAEHRFRVDGRVGVLGRLQAVRPVDRRRDAGVD